MEIHGRQTKQCAGLVKQYDRMIEPFTAIKSVDHDRYHDSVS